MDRGFMEGLFGDYVFPDMTKPNIDSAIGLSKLFFEYYSQINGVEGMFTFPVMTLAISLDEKDEYLDEDFVKWAAKANCEKGLANIFQSRPNAFSSCCRLRNSFDQVADVGYQNSFGVGGLSIGSHRVAGLNLPRIAVLEEKDRTKDIVKEDLEVVHSILYSHRQLMKDLISRGSLPLYPAGWISLCRQYSTVGFIGSYEYLKNRGFDVRTEEGLGVLVDLLKRVENTAASWQVKESGEGNIYNVEQIPGESMCVRLCELDSILGFNPLKFEMYSNQYIPLVEDASISDRMKIQGKVDSLTSGGAILHVNVDDDKPLNAEMFERLMDRARQSKVVYFAINYPFSECEDGHYVIGRNPQCAVCGKKIVNVYTRVVGFLTPTRSWSKKRRDWEFPKRKFYSNGEIAS